MIIDGHSHVTLPIAQHIEAMDLAGVAKTVLFSTAIHPEQAQSAQEMKEIMGSLNKILAGKTNTMAEVRQKGNAELAEAISSYPTRFTGFGRVPVGMSDEATVEFVDKYLWSQFSRHHKNSGTFRFGFMLFFPLSLQDIKDAAQYARQYPHTPVILGHLGGSNWLETIDLVKDIPNLYLDTSASYSQLVLEFVIHELPHKSIFGVDRPYGDLQLSIDTIEKLAQSRMIADAVLGGNIGELLKL